MKRKKSKIFFVSGTDTGIGKTLISSILVSKISGSYWKPIQCGKNYFGQTDANIVKNLSSGLKYIYSEKYIFNDPLSPNIASKNSKTSIRKSKLFFDLKKIEDDLIIEGAGGLMVPITNNYLMIDYIKDLSVPLILVSSTKLGTINHTLLSLESIKKRNIFLKGIVFNGHENPEVISTIKNFAKKIFKDKINVLGHIPLLKRINKNIIKRNLDRITL